MRAIKHLYLVVWIVLLWNMAVLAIEITAVGEGHTRQEAINNGIRTAIEQALGTYIKSTTEIGQGKTIYDRIASASAGYVKDYKVLVEGKDPITDTYKVRLSVVIDDYRLKSAIDEFRKDPRFQRAFQETSFEERRVVVVYKPRTGLDLPYNSKAVQTVMDLIEDKLAEYGFRVFLPSELKRIRGRTAETVVDEKTAIQIARQETGDAVVLVSFDAGKRPTPDGYMLILASLSIKAYDVTTGELFANVQDRGRTISRGGEYGLQDGIARIAIRIGPTCVDRLTNKIVKRFSTKRPKFVVLIFKNVSPKDQDRVEDLLEQDIGWKYRISRQTGSYMEIEVFSEADPTSVRKIMRRRIKKAGLPITPIEMAGNRLTFSGNYTRGGF